MEVYEDPVETYKREFQRKRWEKEQAEKAHKLRINQQTHRIIRYCAFPIVVFAFILLLDKYLPHNVYHEVAELGWQERGAGKGSNRPLYSFMQTQSFTFGVPAEAHVDYPYYETNKPVLTISVTPIFQIPVYVSFPLGSYIYSFETEDHIHNLMLPLPWLLFASSLITILIKKYSRTTYILGFFPIVLVVVTVLKMF